jgi:hypothetical protein
LAFWIKDGEMQIFFTSLAYSFGSEDGNSNDNLPNK